MGEIPVSTKIYFRYKNPVTEETGVFETDEETRDDALQCINGMYDAPPKDCPIYEKPPFILDLGANAGAFAVWAAWKWPGASIDCYEPHPDNMGRLFRNTQHLTKVRHYLAAVSDRTGTVDLYMGKNACCHSLFQKTDTVDVTPIPVRCIDARTLPSCDILKVDIEGAELAVLRTYPHLAECQQVMLEYHKHAEKWELGTILTQAGLVCVREIVGGSDPQCGVLVFAKKK